MVFIDYLTLMLVNMAAGLLVLAYYWWRGVAAENQRAYAPAFLMPGLVATIAGLHMVFTWPLPGAYNSAFGEMSVLLGVLFLGAALATGMNVSLRAVGVYAFVAGLAAIVVGIRILNLGLTKAPEITAAGYILTGLAGLLACPIFDRPQVRWLRVAGCLALVLAALIWLMTAFPAFWMHLHDFAKWVPTTTRPS